MNIEQQLSEAGLSWRIWRAGEKFNKGQLATYRGSLWIAQQDTTSKPGTDAQWKLAVKSGSTTAEQPQKREEPDCAIRAVATALNRPYATVRKAVDRAGLLNGSGAVTNDVLASQGAQGNALGDDAWLKKHGHLAAHVKKFCDSSVPAPKTLREFMRAGCSWHGRTAPAYGFVVEVINPDNTSHAVGFYGKQCSDSPAELEVSMDFPVMLCHVLVAN